MFFFCRGSAIQTRPKCEHTERCILDSWSVYAPINVHFLNPGSVSGLHKASRAVQLRRIGIALQLSATIPQNARRCGHVAGADAAMNPQSRACHQLSIFERSLNLVAFEVSESLEDLKLHSGWDLSPRIDLTTALDPKQLDSFAVNTSARRATSS